MRASGARGGLWDFSKYMDEQITMGYLCKDRILDDIDILAS